LEIVGGRMPDFLPETAKIREASWQVAPQVDELLWASRLEAIWPPAAIGAILDALAA
jgi:hypothetical protein